MGPIKLFWPLPTVEFNGKGISETWAEEMQRQGFAFTQQPEEADCIVFPSDSQLRPHVLEMAPTICYFWGWPPYSWLDESRHRDGFLAHVERQAAMMRRCTLVLAPSYDTLNQLAMLGVRSTLLLPGVDSHLLEQAPEDVEKKPQVLFLSRLVPHKALDELIQAVALLQPAIPLVVSGPGNMTPYQKLAEEVGAQVSFHQFTDQEKLVAIRESAVLVHPSYYEGFGLPPLEAMYLGTPVIVRDIPHMMWVCRGGAHYFNNVEGLAKQIASVLNGGTEIEETTRWAYSYVHQEATLARASQRLGHAIHEAIRIWCGQQMRAHPENAVEIYNRDHRRNWFFRANNFNPEWSRHWRAQHMISELRQTKSVNILDCGCGPVYPTIFARAGFRVTAYDHSEECLLQVEHVAQQWGVADQVTTCRGKAEILPFPNNHFDAVVLGEILEHVSSPLVVLQEALRVVKPEGIVVFTTPHGLHHDDPLHLNHYTKEEFDTRVLQSLPSDAIIVSTQLIAEDGQEPSCIMGTICKKGPGHRTK